MKTKATIAFRKLTGSETKKIKGGKTALPGGSDCIALGGTCSRVFTMTGPICCGHAVCSTENKCVPILA